MGLRTKKERRTGGPIHCEAFSNNLHPVVHYSLLWHIICTTTFMPNLQHLISIRLTRSLIVNLNLEYQWHSRDNNQLKHSKQWLINHKVFMGNKYCPYYSFVVESEIFLLFRYLWHSGGNRHSISAFCCIFTEFHRSVVGRTLDEHITMGIEQALLKIFCIEPLIGL